MEAQRPKRMVGPHPSSPRQLPDAVLHDRMRGHNKNGRHLCFVATQKFLNSFSLSLYYTYRFYPVKTLIKKMDGKGFTVRPSKPAYIW